MEHSRETGAGNAITSRSAETMSPGLEYNVRDWGVSFGGSEKEVLTFHKWSLNFVFSFYFLHLNFRTVYSS